MEPNATPKPRVRRPRPTRYPRQIIALVSDESAEELETTAAVEEVSKGELIRRRLELGRVLEEAYRSTGAGIRHVSAGVRDRIRHRAEAEGVSEGEAIAVMLAYAEEKLTHNGPIRIELDG